MRNRQLVKRWIKNPRKDRSPAALMEVVRVVLREPASAPSIPSAISVASVAKSKPIALYDRLATGHRARSDSPFLLERILAALDMAPQHLALRANVPLHELKKMLAKTPGRTEEVEESEVWLSILGYVDTHISAMMAVRHELTLKAQRERTKKIARRLAIAGS